MSDARRSRARLTLIAFAALAALALAPAARADGPPTSVIAWNTIAQRVIVTVGGAPPPASAPLFAYTQAAVYDAVVAIDGHAVPYAPPLRPRRHASIDAAVATATHDVLVHYFPAQTAALDADLTAALAAIPGGRAKDAGIAVGQAAAAQIVALRQGDGFGVDIGFVMPPPAPGVWQLPAGVAPLTPWMSKLRPFIMNSPDQFRPGPPSALSSRTWARDFNEVKAVGGTTSTVRTPEQTTIAKFWTTPAGSQWNAALGQVALSHGLGADGTARLLAMGATVGADALVACFDAKYHYLFWRPVYAIPLGDTDGNPATVGDPTWTPLVATPNHPEYPSAHGCYSGSQTEVLRGFFGTRHIGIDMSSIVTPTMPVRHFDTTDQVITEVENARVWGGIHYRNSTLVGARIGREVARWDMARAFGVFDPDDDD
jgi:PAP2 superfamily